MSGYVLDVPELYRLLDVQRRKRDLSWRALGRVLDVSPSMFSRMASGAAPDAHALVTFLLWLGVGVARVSRRRGES